MIHINSRSGHEMLTEEQFNERHPGLAAALNAPRPYAEEGEKLKRIRQEADMSQREMAQMTGRKLADISSIEHGRMEITEQTRSDYRMASMGYIKPAGQEIPRDRYPLLYQAMQEEHAKHMPAPKRTAYQDEDDLGDEYCSTVGCDACQGTMPESSEPNGYGCDDQDKWVAEHAHLITGPVDPCDGCADECPGEGCDHAREED